MFTRLNYNNDFLLVVIKTRSNYCFFFSKKRTEFTESLLQFCFSSLMKESMITVRLRYYINSARTLFLAAEVTRKACFFFFHVISRSHFSHSSFTNCKLHTCMLTDADLWWVRCSPINSGITHKVKKTQVGVSGASVKTSSSHHSLNAIYAQPASSTVSLPMGYFQLKAVVQSQVEMCSSSVHLRSG